MFRGTKIDASYHHTKMWPSAHDKSLLYYLLSRRPPPSYFSFLFPFLYLLCLWFYHLNSIFTFFACRGRGQGSSLSFCSLSVQFVPPELLYLPLFFFFFSDIIISFCFAPFTVKSSFWPSSICPLWKRVSVSFVLWRNASELPPITSRYTSNYLRYCSLGLFSSNSNLI